MSTVSLSLQKHFKRTSDPTADGYEPPCGCGDFNSGPLEEKSAFNQCHLSSAGFCFFVKDQVSIHVWVPFSISDCIQLICLSVSVPITLGFYHYCYVVQLEVRDPDSSRSFFILQDCFGISGSVSSFI